MHPDYFRAAGPVHMGPVHTWLNHTLGVSQGVGTVIIGVILMLIVFAIAGAALKSIFGSN